MAQKTSLHPLKVDEAVRGLMMVPSPTPKQLPTIRATTKGRKKITKKELKRLAQRFGILPA